MRLSLLSLLVLLSTLIISCDKKDAEPEVDKPTTPSTLKDGLLLYLPFNGNVADSSGNAIPTTGFGTITFGNNRYFESNKAVKLNGINNRIEIVSPKLENLNKFSFYMEFLPYNQNSMTLLSRTQFAQTDPMNQAFSVMANFGAGTRFVMKKAGNCSNHTTTSWGNIVLGQAIPSINSWNYIAVTFDGTTINTYLNGVLVGTANEANASLCGGAPLIIGSWWQGEPHYFNGLFDELRVYNRALSTTEINEIHKLSK